MEQVGGVEAVEDHDHRGQPACSSGVERCGGQTDRVDRAEARVGNRSDEIGLEASHEVDGVAVFTHSDAMASR
jgi:hypothetical protein